MHLLYNMVPHVRSDDVTVASSRSVLGAAQPLCASAVWGGQRSHFSVPPQKRHSKSGLRGRGAAPGLKCVRGAVSFASPSLSGNLVWSDQRSPNFVRSRRRLRCANGTRSLALTSCAYVRVWRVMEENLQVATMQVKSEAADESASALALGSQDSPAPCGDTACRGGRGGGADQTAEELQAVTTSTPVLLCEYFCLSLEASITLLARIKIWSFMNIWINEVELSFRMMHMRFLLLDPVSAERYFTTSGDGKTYLKIAPGQSFIWRWVWGISSII